MSGWRDVDGRTSADRQRANAESKQKNLVDTLRNRPASLIKPLLGFAFIMVLVFALLLAMP